MRQCAKCGEYIYFDRAAGEWLHRVEGDQDHRATPREERQPRWLEYTRQTKMAKELGR